MRMVDRIRTKLQAEFAPERLEVIDESELHRGHAGARPGGETHFRVTIVAKAFRGKSRLERQRAVHATLAEELAGGIHALSLSVRPPDDHT
ncbi:MAG TPA: BolA family protein [Stellaceae bacterium]|nr:BolA family protein [Stellaceae bacterium]